MSNWALRDDFAFEYQCNAYLLNVNLNGVQKFRITDASSSDALTFGASAGSSALAPENGLPLIAKADAKVTDLSFDFSGEHTITLTQRPDRRMTITIGPKTFIDPTSATVDDELAKSIAFDSRDLHDKTPFGAVVEGTSSEFSISAAHGISAVTLVVEKRRLEGPQEILDYTVIDRVPMRASSDGERERWHASYRFAQAGVYGYSFEILSAGKKWIYQNNPDTIYWTRELGSNGRGMVGNSSDPRRIRRFRQTVYRADYVVPAWAKDAVYYYIFPERFRNGDPRNDPTPAVDTVKGKPIEFHSNWLETPYLPRSGDGSDDIYGNDFFGGDLAGITAKLDYIADLGANALYVTPIFRASSNHKYDTADYKNIDPHFGSNADFVRLTREAARRGIRVITDTSLNHTGSDSIYFDRYARFPGLGAFDGGKIQLQSPYADWYRFDATQTDPDRQYRGWVGAQDLPETNKTSTTFRDYAFGASDSVMKLWLDRGAAGWRMDVAPWVPDEFWRAWRGAVKQHRPDALTIAETQFDASKYFLGDEFDSTMNYIFRNAVQDYANGVDARVIYRNVELMRENYPPQAFYALMNLLSTHDSARALFEFGYRNAQADATTIDLAKQRLRLAVLFQMIFPGAPAVFYGDEVGVTGGEDPFNRVTYPWPDRGGKPDTALLAEFRRLIHLRKQYPALRHGSIEAPVYIDDHVIVLIRRDGAQIAVTATNNDRLPHTISVQLPADLRGASFRDVLGGAKASANNGSVELNVPPLFGVLLVKRRMGW